MKHEAQINQAVNTHIDGFGAELFDGFHASGRDVVLQEILELAETVGDARHERVHAAEVVVLVGVEEGLELLVEGLQVLLDKDLEKKVK